MRCSLATWTSTARSISSCPWGVSCTSELLPPDRPFTAALLRTLPAGLLLVLWCRRWPAWGNWVGWWRLLVLAALNIGVFQALLFVAAYRLPGGVAAVVAYALWFRGIARLPSVAVSSLGLLSPVTAVLLGWALLGQAMTGVSLVGMLVVLASILAAQWAMSRPVPPGGR